MQISIRQPDLKLSASFAWQHNYICKCGFKASFYIEAKCTMHADARVLEPKSTMKMLHNFVVALSRL